MKTDRELQEDVTTELKWNAKLNSKYVHVEVKSGFVNLSGTVESYPEKLALKNAVRKISGVKGVVADIDVEIREIYALNDDEILNCALYYLKRDTNIPEENLKVEVENSWITLEGTVLWNYQKNAALNAVENLTGVKGVNNLIAVRSEMEAVNVKENIEKALTRIVDREAEDIIIEVDGHDVTLVGTVNSWNEFDEAENTAWATPGIWQVKNKLAVKERELV